MMDTYFGNARLPSYAFNAGMDSRLNLCLSCHL
jgi:hypothetical protein